MILGGVKTVAHEPAGVGAEETIMHRRVRVSGRIRVTMVFAMVGRPPERSALGRRSTQDCKDKLRGARSFKSAVGKVSMINSRDREHAHEVENGRRGYGGPTPAHDKNPKTAEM